MNDTQHDAEDTPDSADGPYQQEGFLVVGIGASAGGIEALKPFFSHVREDSDAAYVVILHLSPDHESRLAEVIQNHASIPVTQVRERVKVEPNRAYVVPPNQSLSMEDGHLALSPVNTVEERRAPIDIFFRTLAKAQRGRAVAVVLSGTGADGSSGIARVKECGGICIVQDPTEALHSDMPQHAIDTDVVDDVMLASEIPAKIAAYHEHRAVLARAETEGKDAQRALRDILAQLQARTGHDFASYKRATIVRRVQRRIAVHGLPDLMAYAAWVRDHPEEARALLKDLLISVTNFFRDPEAFKAIELEVMPELFRDKGAQDHVRVWVAGCATGEEVYTLAMLLCEQVSDPEENAPTIQVFATDIDEWALAKARSGFYTHADVASISPERLRRFFTADREGYRVRAELRDMVLFATHNLLKHPPYGHIDLVTCRNLLIYVNRTAQQRILELFHFALNANGFLFLGTAESIDGANELFRPVNKDAHIFRSCAVQRRGAIGFASLNLVPAPAPRNPPDLERRSPEAARDRYSNRALHQQLLEQYAPPSLVVNGENEVVHLSDNAGRYMRVPGGELSRNVFDLVRAELRVELRGALHEAAQHGMRVVTRRVPVHIAGAVEQVRIVVAPVAGLHETDRRFVLILFEAGPGDAGTLPASVVVSDEPEASVRRLQEELDQLQAQLRSAVEQHAFQQEELKASNEELQSINEELRSASEELETGKEELQSYNEELSTVNQELKVKVDELTQANNDTRNLMNSTDAATVFLDRNDRVKRYTPRARDLFKLLPADIGRPLRDLSHTLYYDELFADVDSVLESLQSVEREVETVDGRWYIAKVLPYRTDTDRIEGTVLTFTDITARKHAEDSLRASEEQFRRAIEDAPIPVIMYAEDGQVVELSRAWTRLSGYGANDLPTVDAWLSRAYGYGASTLRDQMQALFSGATPVLDVEFALRTRQGEIRHWRFSASSPGALRDGRRFIVGMAIDVTDPKRDSAALVRTEAHLRLTLDAVTEYAIFTSDAQGLIGSWNVGAEHIFQYTEREALGQSAAMIFTPEDRAQGAPEAEMQIARETGAAADERWHLRKDGTRFFASGVLSCIRTGGEVLGYVKVAQDLTVKRESEEALRQRRDVLEEKVVERTRELAEANETLQGQIAERTQSEELRVRLLGRLVDAQEDERRRLSRELHDQFGQQVTALALKVSSLKARPDFTPAVQRELEALEAIVRQLDVDIDHLAWELRPTALDDLGLLEALNDYIRTWSTHFGLKAELHTSGIQRARLPDEVQTVLYRITQEALNNVAKHAGASRVELILEQRADHVSLIIEDDGVGFDAEAAMADSAGLGLVGMRERTMFAGGSVQIESSVGKGTSVFVRIPTLA